MVGISNRRSTDCRADETVKRYSGAAKDRKFFGMIICKRGKRWIKDDRDKKFGELKILI